ncbi:nitroreductase/quinone reductase family protein [Blastococcus sp. SYSU D00922]
MAGRSWFWTNRVANPVLLRVLRTRLGRGLGRSLAVVRYTGRRTAIPHDLVCQYVRNGDLVWILVGQAGRKTWWRNLRAPAPVEVWLGGRHLRGTAVAVVGAEEPEECGRGLAVYGATGTAPADAVMVRVDLQPS